MPAFEESHANDGAYFKFRYDEIILELIKSIPWEGRKWEHPIKSWWIASDYIDYARYVLKGEGILDYRRWYLDRCQARTRQLAPPPRARAPYEELAKLLEDGSDDLIRTVFAKMLHYFHPDVGGDHTQMVRLNAAWEQIKNIRGMK